MQYEFFANAHKEILRKLVLGKDTLYVNEEVSFYELINYSFTISTIHTYFTIDQIMSRSKYINYEYAADFFSWIMSGKSELWELKEKYPIAGNFEFCMPDSFNTYYGPRILAQLDDVKNELVHRPNTRRAVITILDSKDSIIYKDKAYAGTRLEYPCTETVHFLLRDTALYTIVNMRSNNAFNVIGYDTYNFINLHNEMVTFLRTQGYAINEGYYMHNCGSLHLFEKDLEKAKELI